MKISYGLTEKNIGMARALIHAQKEFWKAHEQAYEEETIEELFEFFGKVGIRHRCERQASWMFAGTGV